MILVVTVCLSTHFNWAVILKCQKRQQRTFLSFFCFRCANTHFNIRKKYQRFYGDNDISGNFQTTRLFFLQLFTLHAIDYHLDDNWVRTAFRYTIKFEHLWYRGRACMHTCAHRFKCHFTDWFGSLEMHDMNRRIY